MTIVNIVIRETRHNIADLAYSKTQTLQATLRIQSQPQVVSCVFLEAEQLSQSVGCAGNKHQFLIAPQGLKLFLWVLDFVWMGYLLLTYRKMWSRCYVQPRTTFNLVTLAQAPKILHEKNWRVSLCVQEHHHPPKFPWILAATPGDLSRQTTGVTVLSWSPFYLFLVGFLVGLATLLVIGFTANNGCPRSIINIETWHRHWRGYHFQFDPLFLESHCHLMLLSLVKKTSFKKMWNNASPVLKVSLMLKSENWRKNSLTSLEPRSERSSPCCIVSEYRF